jgi:hypothetical protein
LLALLNPFLTHKLPAAVYLSFPATFFLAYTIFALCLLLSQIFLEFEVNPAILNASRPRPITINIHVATRSAAVPINLARSSGFQLQIREQYQGVQKPTTFLLSSQNRNTRNDLASTRISRSSQLLSPLISSDQLIPRVLIVDEEPIHSNSIPLQFFNSARAPKTSFLLSLLLAQLALCASYSCKLAIDYKPSSAHVLEIVHTSLSVVSVMATMKAYLREFPRSSFAYLNCWPSLRPRDLMSFHPE